MSANFTAVTFNIFARSLGSSVIPWVLSVSPHAQTIVRSFDAKFDVKAWVKDAATKAYKLHFHRNFASGDKETMRSMWSACIESQEDVPPILHAVKVVAPDTLCYKVDGCEHIAVTLRGLLRQQLPAVADELFKEFVKDERFFMWEARGPLIFETATKLAISELAPGQSSQQFSDIVTLCEVGYPTEPSQSARHHRQKYTDTHAFTQPVRRAPRQRCLRWCRQHHICCGDGATRICEPFFSKPSRSINWHFGQENHRGRMPL